jgi:hypothetical protein
VGVFIRLGIFLNTKNEKIIPARIHPRGDDNNTTSEETIGKQGME